MSCCRQLVLRSSHTAVRVSGTQFNRLAKDQVTAATEFVVCGFTEGKGSRKHLGALLLGAYRNGKLRYFGHSGTGFTEKGLAEAIDQLRLFSQTNHWSRILARIPREDLMFTRQSWPLKWHWPSRVKTAYRTKERIRCLWTSKLQRSPYLSDPYCFGNTSPHDGPITLADEQAQWMACKAKLAQNHMTVGPSIDEGLFACY